MSHISRAPRHVAVRLAVLCVLLAAFWAPPVPAAPAAPAMQDDETQPPETVTIPGTIQSQLGCPGDWQPDCANTFLTYDTEDDVWQGAWDLDAGAYEYKVALNGSWSWNYGLKATRNGPNIPLALDAPANVKFYYDHKTHWATDNRSSPIPVAIGDFQSEIGCASDNAPGCLRTWMEDPGGEGVFSVTTPPIPAGDYEVRVAMNESLDETYGEGGAPGGPAIKFTVTETGTQVYFGFDPKTHILTVSTEGAPRGNLSRAQAHWVTAEALLWNVVGAPGYSYFLHYDPAGAMTLTPKGIDGGQVLTLTFAVGGPGGDVFKQFPHLAGFSTLKLDPADAPKVPEILKGQIALSTRDPQGKMVDATAVQIPGVLDDLYPYDGPLGVTYEGQAPTLRVWAPTARSVTLHLYDDATAEAGTAVPTTLDAATGVWSAAGTADWTGKFYLYEVEVFVRTTGQVERNLVTDPYSLSLATDSRRSQVINLSDPGLFPPGWQDLQKPPLDAPEDIVIYELHVRDFSITDESVPAEERGTFRAFTHAESNGMKHLKALAGAGLTHVHLLPAFDFATVEEDRAQRQEPDAAALAALPPDSGEQAALIEKTRGVDGFNWGYDPYHYTVPEGSYATDPDGPARILEFREMVQALNQAGLRVVMDVVYNHTTASGQDAKSVLDKIVPGYYHRLNAIGNVENSTCCQNTATEHAMMEKLMIDSVLTWATAYRVDGFRFDLMGHHMVTNMTNVRGALDQLNPERDGVDGPSIYVYGEGWDFGEVAENARGRNATQLNLGGTGIGTFNDRMRDGARGGGPFDDPRMQGFLTGLAVDTNDFEQGTPEEQLQSLLHQTDWVRLGLAGSLAGYEFERADGKTAGGAQLDYRGKPAGYTVDPQEAVNYVSAHDNETLFDAIQWKASPGATIEDRVRMQQLGLDVVLLSQGVPFFHAGDDLLRSKSLNPNSYDSGDWFNRLDFTYASNNWGIGLPPEGRDHWPLMQPLLANPGLKPSASDIQATTAHFQDMLRIRRSSGLFRMRTAEEIQQRLQFYNTGQDQVPGLIVMSLDNTTEPRLEDPYGRIVVLFNATPEEQSFTIDVLQGMDFALHPVQQASADARVRESRYDSAAGTFTVPARSTAVFVAAAAPEAPAAAPTAASTLAPATAPATAPPAATAIPPAGPDATTTAIGAIVAFVLAAAGVILWRRRRR